MASSLKVVSSKLLTRSTIPFRPSLAAAASNHLHAGCHLANHRRGFSTISFYEVFSDKFFPATRNMKMLWKKITYTYAPVKLLKPAIWLESKNFLYLYLRINGVTHEKFINVSVDHNTIFIQAKTIDDRLFTHGFHKYVCWIDLPDIDSSFKRYNISDIKADRIINEGELKITIPKLKQHEKVFNVKVNAIG